MYNTLTNLCIKKICACGIFFVPRILMYSHTIVMMKTIINFRPSQILNFDK